MRTLAALAVCLSLPALHAAEGDLAVARQFTAQLTLQQAADEKIFAAVGRERAHALLSAVMLQGASMSATALEWTGLHRALSGLIELNLWAGDIFKASFYAGVQQMYYGSLEHNYLLGLEFAHLAYDLQEKSGQKLSQFLNLLAIGENLLYLAQAREALDYFHRAQECMDGPYTSTAAVTWRRILQAHAVLRDFTAAEADLQRLQDAARSAPALFVAHAMLGEAEIRMEQGSFPAALDALKRAQAAIKNDPKSDLILAEITKDLLSCVLDAMRILAYDESLELAHRVETEFPGFTTLLMPFAEQTIRVRRLMAGEIDGILREDVARLHNARAAGNVPGQIAALRSLAVSYRASNARGQEIAALEEALDLNVSSMQRAGQSATDLRLGASDHLRSLDLLAYAYLAAADPARARVCLDEVLHTISSAPDTATRERWGGRYASAMLGKARLAEMDKDLDEARDILEKAIKDPRFDRADVLGQFARLERDAGEKPAYAVNLYRQTIALLQTSRERTSEITIRFELALYLATRGAKLPDAARQSAAELDLVEPTARANRMVDILWRIPYVRGVLAETAGAPGRAIESYASAIEQLEAIRGNLSGEEQRQAFMDNATADDLYRRMVAALIAGGRQADAWKYIERSKARAFLEMLQGRRFRDTTPETAELRSIEQKLDAIEAQSGGDSQAVVRSSGKISAVLDAEKHDLQNRLSLLRAESSLAGSRQGSVLSTRPIELPELQKLLPPHAALVEYYFLDKSLCAFVVTRGGHQLLCQEVVTHRLRQSVLRVRPLLAIANPGDELARLLQEIGAVLLDPVLAVLPKDTRDLIVIPAGYLNYIPFQVLPLPSGEALIERFTVSYLPSASTLRSLGASRAKSGHLSLCALGNLSVDGLPALPGTLREVADIAKVSPGAERITQAAFTHDALRQALGSHDQIHIATHGVLDEQTPLFSALLTSPAAGQPARLSLYELTNMNLKARLVVLSACETGIGQLMAGDEVVGLTRTFLQAGADTVISSLWKVSDASTALLMAEFHRLMGNGEGPAQALRDASLKVRKQYPQPFFWAPFILTGAR